MSKKIQERKIKGGKLSRFFRIELTDGDCYNLLMKPEVVAESLEVEFHPSTFIQFINTGLGTRFALMRKKDGDE